MNKSFTLVVVDGGDSDLSKEDRAVARRPTSNQHEIAIGEGEMGQLVIGKMLHARPHLGFVLIPVVS